MKGPLSKREQQVMELLYATEGLAAEQVRGALDDAPSNGAVRAVLIALERKGLLRRTVDGPRHRYWPVGRSEARTSAMQRLVDAFFGGDPARAAFAMLEDDDRMPPEELARLRALIERAQHDPTPPRDA
jgi:predicted transcriptional regulator